MIECLRSVPTPAAIAAEVTERYGRPVTDCALIRTYTNDVYAVSCGERRYVLKLYQQINHHDAWSLDEIAWEQDLAAHVAGAGVPVPRSIPLADGRLAGLLPAPEGPRPYALTEFVAGSKPRPPWTDGLFAEYGALIARFHVAAEGLRSDHDRRDFDLQLTLEEPLAALLPRLADRPGDQHLVSDLAHRARENLSGAGLRRGIRHGDVSLDNIIVGESGLVLHDFDLAGPGWLAADFAMVASQSKHWDAFAAGYTRIRELPDRPALPALTIVHLIANLAFLFVEQPALRGTETLDDPLVDRELDSLRQLAGVHS
ncbi:MAG TPA: phosphotransferase [Mycobacteriales bacterium]|nr:phosphotransferase [Mycobacteriales bacterium]